MVQRVPSYSDQWLRDYTVALRDVQEYFSLTDKEFWALFDQWPKIEKSLFTKRESVTEFYQLWAGDAAKANICVNVFNQFLFAEVYCVMRHYYPSKGRVLDYGCGTASVSLAVASRAVGMTELVVADVQRDVRAFIDYRLKKMGLFSAKTADVLALDIDVQFDFVMCIDVLEHLENSAEVFCEHIAPRVKVGGLLFLRAPWRGQLTHIDAAPDNFYREGGRRFLSDNFAEVYRVGGGDINAVYRRKK